MTKQRTVKPKAAKPTGKAVAANPVGRPSKWKPEYAEQAYKFCLLGATDERLAELFEVNVATISGWKISHPEFLEALKSGKEKADAEIAASLFQRAKGYSHPDVHVSNFQGVVTLTPIQKYYPPDTPAATMWLKNRQGLVWRDKQEVNHGGVNGENIKVDLTLTPADAYTRMLGGA